ncbi:hypothetical protein EVAR_47882_1 [Eumeta japonica]|uniref:Uncharacterized protein n=1 Tax=Eumeta variegata TaxID=151549 RepID=A0A4C1YBR3_EUMVA|nr:hypothetical protein EVAR_47882_1 [Eumeta japonica]
MEVFAGLPHRAPRDQALCPPTDRKAKRKPRVLRRKVLLSESLFNVQVSTESAMCLCCCPVRSKIFIVDAQPVNSEVRRTKLRSEGAAPHRDQFRERVARKSNAFSNRRSNRKAAVTSELYCRQSHRVLAALAHRRRNKQTARGRRVCASDAGVSDGGYARESCVSTRDENEQKNGVDSIHEPSFMYRHTVWFF